MIDNFARTYNHPPKIQNPKTPNANRKVRGTIVRNNFISSIILPLTTVKVYFERNCLGIIG